ncbi:hypothetical protein GCM10017784_20280 [Deinococcus indicus]|nr:hypothetical protein GCM10017784_20280 [Deinococcus indicus]
MSDIGKIKTISMAVRDEKKIFLYFFSGKITYIRDIIVDPTQNLAVDTGLEVIRNANKMNKP